MIAHKRVAKEKDAEKAEHRKQREQIVRSGKEHRATPFRPDQPQSEQSSQCPKQRQIVCQPRRVNLPPWIDENKRLWPDKFAEIEPDRATRDDEPFRPGLRPLSANCAGMELLFQNRPDADKR